MSEQSGTVPVRMRLGSLALAALVAGSFSPAGDAVRDEIRDIRASQYDKGRRAACNIRVLNALTSQDLAQVEAAEKRCARYLEPAPAAPQG